MFIVVMHLAKPSYFTDMPLKLKETNIQMNITGQLAGGRPVGYIPA